ncbi:MAG TPA: c-type cytochrome [Rhodoferax sp.]|jgi:cytochrome c5|nr:c-type cytochrome [Rhodoferax sp.]HPW85275.1 c-type cytochrome [Rhodoferax sp.]HQC86591.1 c-type cytochrome [Rhodoferax sp.]
MSDHSTATKGPKQLIVTGLFSFLIPILIIGGLVYTYMSGGQSTPVSANPEKAVAQRIQKIGSVEIGDANREARTGEQVFNAQCTACHTAGVAGAPKFGDAGAWGARIATGFEALLNSALKGKGAMGAQGGGDFSDYEVARAVVYMANGSGGKLAEPKKPEAAK